MFPFESTVDKAILEQADEGVVFNMAGKGKVDVGGNHTPFFLELCRGLAVVWSGVGEISKGEGGILVG